MKKLFLLSIAAGIVLNSCRKIEVDGETVSITDPTGGTSREVVLEGKISKDTKLTADKVYYLRKGVLVTGNATLTIEPGTTILGETSTHGYLVITRGSKIIAEGTKEKPIVFTSQGSQFGTAKSGDWGGLVILGKAPPTLRITGRLVWAKLKAG